MRLGNLIKEFVIKSSNCHHDDIDFSRIQTTNSTTSVVVNPRHSSRIQLNVEDVLGVIMEFSSSSDLVNGWSRTDKLSRQVSVLEWKSRCKNMTDVMTKITQIPKIKMMQFALNSEITTEEIYSDLAKEAIFFQFDKIVVKKKICEWIVILNDTKEGSDAFMVPVRDKIHKSNLSKNVDFVVNFVQGTSIYHETEDHLFKNRYRLFFLNKELSSEEKCILLYGLNILNQSCRILEK